MNPEEFKAPEAGKCVRTIGRFWAFLPAPLPPKLSFDNSMVMALSQADAALGEIAGLTMGGTVSRMHMLIQAFARREAVLSSRIEGTHTQLDDLLLAEAKDQRATEEDQDLREVQNYVIALEKGTKSLKTRPIATRLILELHATLMEGVRSGDKTPGEFRKVQNFIGKTGDTVETAKYVPPPVEELGDLLNNWEQFANERGTWPDLIQCAILHEQFEAIHPFQDGNGRVGRLLITLFLIERKRLLQPLYLSAFIEAHRRDYYDLLQGVHTEGDWASWIRFFLRGVTVTSRQAVRHAQHLDALRRGYRDQLKGQLLARGLLEELFSNPYITTARAAQRLSVTTPTAQKSINQLQRMGILEEVTGKAWGRIYLARLILKAIETPPPAEET